MVGADVVQRDRQAERAQGLDAGEHLGGTVGQGALGELEHDVELAAGARRAARRTCGGHRRVEQRRLDVDEQRLAQARRPARRAARRRGRPSRAPRPAPLACAAANSRSGRSSGEPDRPAGERLVGDDLARCRGRRSAGRRSGRGRRRGSRRSSAASVACWISAVIVHVSDRQAHPRADDANGLAGRRRGGGLADLRRRRASRAGSATDEAYAQPAEHAQRGALRRHARAAADPRDPRAARRSRRTFYVPGDTAERHTDALPRGRRRRPRDRPSRLPAPAQRRDLAQTQQREEIERGTRRRSKTGSASPRAATARRPGSSRPRRSRCCIEHGFEWDSSLMGDDRPYRPRRAARAARALEPRRLAAPALEAGPRRRVHRARGVPRHLAGRIRVGAAPSGGTSRTRCIPR